MSRAGKPVSRFCALLRHHLDNGTRPDGMPGRLGRRWRRSEFAARVTVSDSTVVKWLSDKAHPNDFPSVEEALFGDNLAFELARRQFRDAYDLLPDRRKRPAGLKTAIKRPWVINALPITLQLSKDIQAFLERGRGATSGPSATGRLHGTSAENRWSWYI